MARGLCSAVQLMNFLGTTPSGSSATAYGAVIRVATNITLDLDLNAVGVQTTSAFVEDFETAGLGKFQASTLDHLTPQQRAEFTGSLPKQRLIAPEEIANIIVFLASGYSTPLHGAVIDASMGLGVRPGLITERAH